MVRRHIKTAIIAGIVVGVAVILAVISSWGDSPIVDEIPHIGAGYSYLERGDMRLNPEHPPLAKDIAAAPLLFMGLDDRAFDQKPWTTDINGQWQFGRTLIFASGNDADAIKNMARLAVLAIFFLGACYFVWRWSRERYGDTAALIATILFAFSPTVLAHARFVTTDVPAAAGVLVATYFFLRFLRAPSPGTFIWSALTLGLALLCKFNNVLLGPYFMLVALLYALDGHLARRKAWRRAMRAMVLTTAIGIAAFVGVVWPVYIAQTWNYPIARQATDTRAILASQGDNILKEIALWASDKPIIRGAGHWVLGLAMVRQRSLGGNTIYWLGSVVTAGGPWYFPVVYFLKEPLAWWILAAMAITALAFHRRRFKTEPARGGWFSRNTDEWIWLVWLIIYWSVSIRSTLNIGIRHLLPVYPFTIMLVAGRLSVLTDWLRQHDRIRWKAFSAGIALLLGWYVFESVHVFPYYLTYFNQIAGGPSGGYRYVTDSNLDWGQDLKRLGTWVRDHDIDHLSLDYFGWSDPSYYLKDRYIYTSVGQWRDARDFIARNRSNGWIAISATFLQEARYRTNQDNGGYRWLFDYDPVTVVGNSIFVYHIEK
jgi:hypothetical protein